MSIKKRITVTGEIYSDLAKFAINNGYSKGNSGQQIESFLNSRGIENIIKGSTEKYKSVIDKLEEDLKQNKKILDSTECIILSKEAASRFNKLLSLGVLNSERTEALTEIIDFYVENNKDAIINAASTI